MQSPSDVAESEDCNKKDETEPPKPQLTKRQLRKLIKREKWEKALPEKRAKEKLKMKQKRHSARLNNEVLGPSRKMLKANKMATSECKLRVALDMSFDDLMIEKDIAKCTKQLLRCYSFNRRAENPVQFYVTSFEGKIRDEMKKQTGYEHWDVYLREEHYSSVFEAKDLVYLSSESDNVINELDHSKVYIIGGLVDHNSQKGLCHRLAEERGIAHGRLPIGEFLEMSSRKVLAINHVFEIVVAVSQGSSWQRAMVATLPQRKGAVAKPDFDGKKAEGASGTADKNIAASEQVVVVQTEAATFVSSEMPDVGESQCENEDVAKNYVEAEGSNRIDSEMDRSRMAAEVAAETGSEVRGRKCGDDEDVMDFGCDAASEVDKVRTRDGDCVEFSERVDKSLSDSRQGS